MQTYVIRKAIRQYFLLICYFFFNRLRFRGTWVIIYIICKNNLFIQHQYFEFNILLENYCPLSVLRSFFCCRFNIFPFVSWLHSFQLSNNSNSSLLTSRRELLFGLLSQAFLSLQLFIIFILVLLHCSLSSLSSPCFLLPSLFSPSYICSSTLPSPLCLTCILLAHGIFSIFFRLYSLSFYKSSLFSFLFHIFFSSFTSPPLFACLSLYSTLLWIL